MAAAVIFTGLTQGPRWNKRDSSSRSAAKKGVQIKTGYADHLILVCTSGKTEINGLQLKDPPGRASRTRWPASTSGRGLRWPRLAGNPPKI